MALSFSYDPGDGCKEYSVDLADYCGIAQPGTYEIAALTAVQHELILGPLTLVVEEPKGPDKEVMDQVLLPFLGDSKCAAIRAMQPRYGVFHKWTHGKGCPSPIIKILQEYPTSTYAAYAVHYLFGGAASADPGRQIERIATGTYYGDFYAPYEDPQEEFERTDFTSYYGENAARWRERWGNLVLANHPDFRFADEIRLCLAVDQIALKRYGEAAQSLDRLAKDDKSPMAQKAKEYLGFMKQKGWTSQPAAAAGK